MANRPAAPAVTMIAPLPLGALVVVAAAAPDAVELPPELVLAVPVVDGMLPELVVVVMLPDMLLDMEPVMVEVVPEEVIVMVVEPEAEAEEGTGWLLEMMSNWGV